MWSGAPGALAAHRWIDARSVPPTALNRWVPVVTRMVRGKMPVQPERLHQSLCAMHSYAVSCSRCVLVANQSIPSSWFTSFGREGVTSFGAQSPCSTHVPPIKYSAGAGKFCSVGYTWRHKGTKLGVGVLWHAINSIARPMAYRSFAVEPLRLAPGVCYRAVVCLVSGYTWLQ